MLIHLDYDFMGWNDYIRVERGSKYKANNIKQEEKAYIGFTVRERYTGTYPVTLTLRPHYQHKRGDLDNFRMKGLIDGLVSAGVIENDNLTKIDKIILEPVFDDIRGVDVEITPSQRKKFKAGYSLTDFVNGLTDEEKESLRAYIESVKGDL